MIVVEESRADAVLDVVSKTDDGVLRRVRQWFIEDDTSLGNHNVLSFVAFCPSCFLLVLSCVKSSFIPPILKHKLHILAG